MLAQIAMNTATHRHYKRLPKLRKRATIATCWFQMSNLAATNTLWADTGIRNMVREDANMPFFAGGERAKSSKIHAAFCGSSPIATN